MTLVSVDYFIFLFVTTLLVWLFKKQSLSIITIFSFLFIASWGFKSLITFSSLLVFNFVMVFYYQKKRINNIVFLALAVNLLVLVVFKLIYSEITNSRQMELLPYKLIPIGLSYYSLQMVAYLIDLSRRQIPQPFNFKEFLFFNSFFPQLTIGPIERYSKMAHQLRSLAGFNFNLFHKGIVLILLGLVKKLVVSDRILESIDYTTADTSTLLGASLWSYNLLAFFQIYCDFSGYTDIARGSANLLGFKISKNFNAPYLATSIPGMWSRWHMTLVSWVRDYIYLPITLKIKNTGLALLISFLFVAAWHKISFNFLAWALYWTFLSWIHGKYRHLSLFRKTPVILKHLYVLMALSLSSLFFINNSFSQGINSVGRLFVFDSSLFSSLLLLPNFKFDEMLIALFGLFTVIVIEFYWNKIKEKNLYISLLTLILTIVLTALARTSSYPFLYLSY